MGLGKATAKRFAQAGARVPVHFMAAGLSYEEGVANWDEGVLDEVGGIDSLANHAGGGQRTGSYPEQPRGDLAKHTEHRPSRRSPTRSALSFRTC